MLFLNLLFYSDFFLAEWLSSLFSWNLPHLLTQPHSPRSAIHNNNAGSFSTMFTWDLQNNLENNVNVVLLLFYQAVIRFASLHWHMSKLPDFLHELKLKCFLYRKKANCYDVRYYCFWHGSAGNSFICSC